MLLQRKKKKIIIISKHFDRRSIELNDEHDIDQESGNYFPFLVKTEWRYEFSLDKPYNRVIVCAFFECSLLFGFFVPLKYFNVHTLRILFYTRRYQVVKI